MSADGLLFCRLCPNNYVTDILYLFVLAVFCVCVGVCALYVVCVCVLVCGDVCTVFVWCRCVCIGSVTNMR